jgi:cell division protein FtsL
MKWNLTIFFAVLFVGVSYGLYQLSYEVQELEKDLRAIKRTINDNEQGIEILKAEWAYQNRPKAIQELAGKYLPLLLVAPYQVAGLGDLPERQMDPGMRNILSMPVPRQKPRFVTEQEPVDQPDITLASFKVGAGSTGGVK